MLFKRVALFADVGRQKCFYVPSTNRPDIHEIRIQKLGFWVHMILRKRFPVADEFFKMNAGELEKYIDFLDENSPFSTQHGSKGEEYQNVLVLIDDIEAAWNTYSFSKVLTPGVAGDPTDRQKELTQKLAYVCFSRAEVNLRILMFSRDSEAAIIELVGSGLFQDEQVSIL